MNALVAWFFVAVWGAGYVATKAGLQYAPPFTFLSLRFLFGLLCLVPVLLLFRARRKLVKLMGNPMAEMRGKS